MLESTQQPVWGSRALLCGPNLPPSPRVLVTAPCGRSRYTIVLVEEPGGCLPGFPNRYGTRGPHGALTAGSHRADSERAQCATFFNAEPPTDFEPRSLLLRPPPSGGCRCSLLAGPPGRPCIIMILQTMPPSSNRDGDLGAPTPLARIRTDAPTFGVARATVSPLHGASSASSRVALAADLATAGPASGCVALRAALHRCHLS